MIGGVMAAAISAAVGAYIYDSRKYKKRKGDKRKDDPALRHLDRLAREIGFKYNPNDPNDPMAALIAAGEYFRQPGYEPGGPYYEETFNRILHMIEAMVPPDRLDFWVEQVYRLYGSKSMHRQRKDRA